MHPPEPPEARVLPPTGLQQLRERDLAERLGVCVESVGNWERGRPEPALSSWPAVIDFLGFVPFPLGESLPERIRAWRTIHGVLVLSGMRLGGSGVALGLLGAIVAAPRAKDLLFRVDPRDVEVLTLTLQPVSWGS